MEATRPLQDSLDLKIEDQWEVQKCIRLLPNPLYLLYANVSAYNEACDSLITTTINGDEEDTKQDSEDTKEIEEAPIVDEANHDSENDDNENDADVEVAPKKRHHHGRQSKAAAIGLKRDLLFKPHPLSVTVIVSDWVYASKKFEFLHHLVLYYFIFTH